MNLSGADMQLREMQDRLAAVTARAEAAEQALRLATKMTTGSTAVMIRLDVWEAFLADIDRYGADQWRRGNAGREPQELAEWRHEQAADRRAAFNGGEI